MKGSVNKQEGRDVGPFFGIPDPLLFPVGLVLVVAAFALGTSSLGMNSMAGLFSVPLFLCGLLMMAGGLVIYVISLIGFVGRLVGGPS